MEGASGDDWISVAQSMRAYLRFSMLGGVIARQIRNLGFRAKAHTVLDGDVLQPPLLLLSGLGEVSRIGEVILHPFLGPRLKSGVVTTTMPLAHDRPDRFRPAEFLRELPEMRSRMPSGAITAGPKIMFNGYETWKSDSQKCTSYRITTKGGAMCGRCMKTCPWNLEGLFAEAPFRWVASNVPVAAKWLAALDDAVGRGGLNDRKKWWWDIELAEDGAYRPASHPVNRRGLSRNLKLRHEDQTMAVYPAPLAPHPYPYPYPMDREAGIRAFQELVSAGEYRRRLAEGDTSHVHRYVNADTPAEESPVIQAVVSRVETMSHNISKYEFATLDGSRLPAWTAGAHIDVLVAPGMMRQYSMSGDPANRHAYQVAVLREDDERGGSLLMHRIFTEGRKVFISRPINHFDLNDTSGQKLPHGWRHRCDPYGRLRAYASFPGPGFELHYSVSTPDDLAFAGDLDKFDWRDHVFTHVSADGGRADLDAIFDGAGGDDHVYACGPDGYMDAVIAAAAAAGIRKKTFIASISRFPSNPTSRTFPSNSFCDGLANASPVTADETASDALIANGYAVDVKCSDGLCGVCKCGVVGGAVEHRDFVLSERQRGYDHPLPVAGGREGWCGGIGSLEPQTAFGGGHDE